MDTRTSTGCAKYLLPLLFSISVNAAHSAISPPDPEYVKTQQNLLVYLDQAGNKLNGVVEHYRTLRQDTAKEMSDLQKNSSTTDIPKACYSAMLREKRKVLSVVRTNYTFFQKAEKDLRKINAKAKAATDAPTSKAVFSQLTSYDNDLKFAYTNKERYFKTTTDQAVRKLKHFCKN